MIEGIKLSLKDAEEMVTPGIYRLMLSKSQIDFILELLDYDAGEYLVEEWKKDGRL